LSDGRKKEIYQYIRFFHGALQLNIGTSTKPAYFIMAKTMRTEGLNTSD